jgi:hypothetical protein
VGALALLALVANGACAVTGTYEPRSSRCISQLDPAARVYVREGRRIEVGLAGSAEDLVSGNDLAIRFARRSHRQVIAGWTLYTTGVAALGTGIALLASSRRDADGAVAGRILVGTSLVPMIVSLPLFLAAFANRQDAVNIYNDALEGAIDAHAFDDHAPPGGR